MTYGAQRPEVGQLAGVQLGSELRGVRLTSGARAPDLPTSPLPRGPLAVVLLTWWGACFAAADSVHAKLVHDVRKARSPYTK
ncbi:hypothetical protein SAMN05216337_1010150 [Bradyrhizobium brasilense]|uniref:Uncharacterized protein n=1 Tax=Bradyrhizobium brasilense TaxID=1419277 RepID=A0A1G6U7B3_9BRAD|nr:hypothetical protein SAMN05216337_1010150 [Bradyrhizobium brasilense]